MDATEALSELRYLELELSSMMDAASGRMTDHDDAEELRRIGEQHRMHAGQAAEALQRIGAVDAQPGDSFRAHVHATEREVMHARDEGGLFNGLADAERYNLRLHEHILAAADIPANVTDLVAQQTDAERVSVRLLESRAPAFGPEIGGVRTAPRGGPA